MKRLNSLLNKLPVIYLENGIVHVDCNGYMFRKDDGCWVTISSYTDAVGTPVSPGMKIQLDKIYERALPVGITKYDTGT